MVRPFRKSIFGCAAAVSDRSITMHETEWWASSRASVVPTGPAPTISTGWVSAVTGDRSGMASLQVDYQQTMDLRDSHVGGQLAVNSLSPRDDARHHVFT
jgi:hypothetical protein